LNHFINTATNSVTKKPTETDPAPVMLVMAPVVLVLAPVVLVLAPVVLVVTGQPSPENVPPLQLSVSQQTNKPDDNEEGLALQRQE